MGDLTRNFSVSEFVCPCCGEAQVDGRLADALQELRDVAGAPIKIESGVRCPKHNLEEGGRPRSLHLQGEAADIVIEGRSVKEMYELAERVAEFRLGGIGVYPGKGTIHVDVRGKRVRWAQLNGEYVPLDEVLNGKAGK